MPIIENDFLAEYSPLLILPFREPVLYDNDAAGPPCQVANDHETLNRRGDVRYPAQKLRSLSLPK
jgi:hypothetical protein